MPSGNFSLVSCELALLHGPYLALNGIDKAKLSVTFERQLLYSRRFAFGGIPNCYQVTIGAMDPLGERSRVTQNSRKRQDSHRHPHHKPRL